MIIYVSGPYSADTEEGRLFNVKTAIFYGIELMRKGHSVIVPHLSHYMEGHAQLFAGGFTWDRWLEQDLEILERCDALYFIGESRGANLEREKALDWGLTVYYSVGEVPDLEVKV